MNHTENRIELSVDDFLEVCKAPSYEDYTLTFRLSALTPLAARLSKAYRYGTVIAAPEGAAWGPGKYQGDCLVVEQRIGIGSPSDGSTILTEFTLRSIAKREEGVTASPPLA